MDWIFIKEQVITPTQTKMDSFYDNVRRKFEIEKQKVSPSTGLERLMCIVEQFAFDVALCVKCKVILLTWC